MTDEIEIIEATASPIVETNQRASGLHSIFNEDAPATLKRVYLEEFSIPVTLSDVQKDAYLRRFATLFVDPSRTRKGSTSRIMHATNAYGEHFALKVRNSGGNSAPAWEMPDETDILEDPQEPVAPRDISDSDDPCNPDTANRLFEHEYERHRILSEVKGYPKLYGKAHLDGCDTLVMEWIEGEDLLRAMPRMSIDDQGRLSPLTAARLGRDIFDVLTRTNLFEDEIVHGDISLRNIMISTSRQSVEQQIQEGSFDVRFIDLGSACVSSSLHAGGKMNPKEENPDLWYYGGATPEFAAPELKRDAIDEPGGRLEYSPAVDVYAAASILCLLLYGEPNPRFTGSAPKTAHDGDSDLSSVLRREPEVAVALHHAASELVPIPSDQEVSDALAQVDEPLAAILRPCLADDPKKRPSAEEVRNALSSFSSSYTSNIGRALLGEALEPCKAPFLNKGIGRLSLRMRNNIRVLGKSASIGLGTAVVTTMAIFIQNRPLVLEIGSLKLEGLLSEALVLMLVTPIILGLLIRGRQKNSFSGFVRGSFGVLLGSVLLFSLTTAAVFDPESYKSLYYWAVFAVSAMSWCPLVLDAAFPKRSAKPRRRKRALYELKRLRAASIHDKNGVELLDSRNAEADGDIVSCS